MSLARLVSQSARLARPAWTARPLAKAAFPRLALSYSSSAGLSRDVIQSRVLDVLKGFEKVDPAKASLTEPALLAANPCSSSLPLHPFRKTSDLTALTQLRS